MPWTRHGRSYKQNGEQVSLLKAISMEEVIGEHEILCCGAHVRISQKGIEVLTEPRISHCPLHESLYGTKRITREAVQKTVETKIRKFGFCTCRRAFNDKPIVLYGASEMMKTWLENNLIDCAVTVCEGAGTVITDNPSLVQGIGARLTGIIKTSPIKETLNFIGQHGGTMLNPDTAEINQTKGVEKAIEKGYRNIAVTVASFQAPSISEIRKLEKEKNVNVVIFSVCNTCLTKENVKHVLKADLVCAGASKLVRQEIGKKALMQLGVTIPIFALTEKGKKLVLRYLAQLKEKFVVFRTRALPYGVERKAPK